ncbi:MAG: spermidine synthase, partial [Solirubrobacterales bacterium]
PIEDTNTLLIATEAPASDDRLAAAIPSLPDDLRVVAAAASERIEPGLDGGDVYTDDKAPVEWLIDRSILGYAGDED